MNTVLKKILRHENSKAVAMLGVIFIAAVVTSVVAVLYNMVFLYGTELARIRFADNNTSVFIVIPAFFLLSAWLCRRFAPHAAGSGPEHVVGALRKLGADGKSKKDVTEYLGFRVMMVKIASSLICITGGGALGREGPVVQISASIFVLIAQKFKAILPSQDLRIWIISGGAAGIAAAFGTPFAGLVFAIEELSKFHSDKKPEGFKLKIFFAVAVSGITAKLLTDTYVLFDFPVIDFAWDWKIALLLLTISLTCGVMAFVLKAIITKSAGLRNSVTNHLWYIFPIAAGLIVATVSFIGGQNTFGAGFFAVQDALKSSTPILTFGDTVGRFINIIASAAAGCAGGLLLPALAVGASIGSVGSVFMPMIDTRVFVVAGMAAFMAALLNAPLTAAVLVLEVTNQRVLILPIFVCALISSAVFKKCGRAGR